MTQEEVVRLLKKAISEGESFIVYEKQGYTQVGIARPGYPTLNITAAINLAFNLPRVNGWIKATKTEVQQHLDSLHRKQRQPMVAPQPVDFDSLTDEEKLDFIRNHPDMISAGKSHEG